MTIKQMLRAIVLIGTIGLTGCNNKYTNATVLEEKEIVVETIQANNGGLFGKPIVYNEKERTYNLKFKTDDGKIYYANVLKRQGENPAYFLALKEAITDGSKIRIENKAMRRFEGLSGILVNDEIEFLAEK